MPPAGLTKGLCHKRLFPYSQRPPNQLPFSTISPWRLSFEPHLFRSPSWSTQGRAFPPWPTMAVTLPREIILQIIDSFAPQGGKPHPIAIPPDDPKTRTLRSLALSCRIAYPLATRLLFQQCLWIDSSHRLERVLYTLEQFEARLAQDQSRTSAASPRLPPISIRRHIESLYLAPFADGKLADFATTPLLHRLVLLLTQHLRPTSCIDMPLRSHFDTPARNHQRELLGRAFAQLTSLEVFCSARDEIFMCTYESHIDPENTEPPTWSHWPNMKILALYNADVSQKFWPYIGQLKSLTSIILTRPDGIDEVNIVSAWEKCRCEGSLSPTVSVVNVEAEHRLLVGSHEWKASDGMMVVRVCVPISYYGDDDIILMCQDWTKKKFLRGEYENFQGENVVGIDAGWAQNVFLDSMLPYSFGDIGGTLNGMVKLRSRDLSHPATSNRMTNLELFYVHKLFVRLYCLK